MNVLTCCRTAVPAAVLLCTWSVVGGSVDWVLYVLLLKYCYSYSATPATHGGTRSSAKERAPTKELARNERREEPSRSPIRRAIVKTWSPHVYGRAIKLFMNVLTYTACCACCCASLHGGWVGGSAGGVLYVLLLYTAVHTHWRLFSALAVPQIHVNLCSFCSAKNVHL